MPIGYGDSGDNLKESEDSFLPYKKEVLPVENRPALYLWNII